MQWNMPQHTQPEEWMSKLSNKRMNESMNAWSIDQMIYGWIQWLINQRKEEKKGGEGKEGEERKKKGSEEEKGEKEGNQIATVFWLFFDIISFIHIFF